MSYDYAETLNLKMIQGRNFSKEFPSDMSNVVINETAAKAIGTESPIGLQFTFWGDEYTIIGVVEDYHYYPLNYEIRPLILAFKPDQYRYILFKIRSKNITDTLAYIERICNKFEPYYPFEYHFPDESYDTLYKNERRLGNIFKYFALLAILISCLGLFGLASFVAEQRTKEIGIRKALGAPVSGIVLLLSKEFTKWVLLANIIAWPIAYYAMEMAPEFPLPDGYRVMDICLVWDPRLYHCPSNGHLPGCESRPRQPSRFSPLRIKLIKKIKGSGLAFCLLIIDPASLNDIRQVGLMNQAPTAREKAACPLFSSISASRH